MGGIHDRQSVILREDNVPTWFSKDTSPDTLRAMTGVVGGVTGVTAEAVLRIEHSFADNTAMRVKVHPLRDRGRKIPWQLVQGKPPILGDLSTCTVGQGENRIEVAQLASLDNKLNDHLLPDLYEPALVMIGPGGLRLRGWERISSGGIDQAVLQEWLCDVA